MAPHMTNLPHAERVRSAVNDLLDGILEPVKVCWEGCVVRESPI